MISVLLPHRNAWATLDEAVASVGAQTGVELELVLVDDNGPQAMGIVGALREGLRRARGDLIARMDADDVCLPGRLARQVEWLTRHPRAGAVGTRVEVLGPAADGLRRYVDWQNGIVTADEHARELFVESPLCHPSVMLRRAALDEVGPWRDGPFPEDYDLWLRLDAAGWQLGKVPEVLLRWRHQDGRLTFTDPRYSAEAFRAAKAPFLARRLQSLARPVAIWGAGPTGKRLARALEPHGIRADRFVDIDPRKIGRPARGVAITDASQLRPGTHTVVVAVGALGARQLIRNQLVSVGFTEGTDFLCAA